MKIDATTFAKLPEHLQALFDKAPNPGRDEVVATFPQQVTKSTGGKNSKGGMGKRVLGTYALDKTAQNTGGLGDEGTPARFFYAAKASKKDRDAGMDNAPQKTAGVGDERPSGSFNERLGKTPTAPRANNHPTVKPTDLMAYLCRLVTPPGGVVLDPFMGSGSTGKAAIPEGFHFIGVECEPAYFDIACERIYNAYRQNTLFGQDENVQEVPASQTAIEFQQE